MSINVNFRMKTRAGESELNKELCKKNGGFSTGKHRSCFTKKRNKKRGRK